jgi:hypothetical protein
MVWAGGQMVWAGGQMVWAGGLEGEAVEDRPAAVDDDYWIEGELVWSGSQVDWLGGEMTWEPGLVVWDGGEMNPSNTFGYTDNWVNDDGTVEPLPEYAKVFLPVMVR